MRILVLTILTLGGCAHFNTSTVERELNRLDELLDAAAANCELLEDESKRARCAETIADAEQGLQAKDALMEAAKLIEQESKTDIPD